MPCQLSLATPCGAGHNEYRVINRNITIVVTIQATVPQIMQVSGG